MEWPESVLKLEVWKQTLWQQTYNRAVEEGYDALLAEAIAWGFVGKSRYHEEWGEYETPAVYWRYPIMSPGVFNPAKGGKTTVTAEDLDAVAEALNRLYSIGQPCAMIYGHETEFPVGVLPAAVVEDEVLYGCLIFDRWFDEGIRTGAMGLSAEGWIDYEDEAYTGGKTFKFWPTAWAILPANQRPAIPPMQPLAASTKKNPEKVRLGFTVIRTAPFRGSQPQGKEALDMDLEKKISELEANLATLTGQFTEAQGKVSTLTVDLEKVTKERDDLVAADTARQVAARKAEIKTKREALLAQVKVPGHREKITAKLDAVPEDLDEQERLIAAYEFAHADLKPTAPKGLRLASQPGQKPDVDDDEEGGDKAVDNSIQAARKLSKEKGISFASAFSQIEAKRSVAGDPSDSEDDNEDEDEEE